MLALNFAWQLTYSAVLILCVPLQMVRGSKALPTAINLTLERSFSRVLSNVLLQVTPGGELLAAVVIFTAKGVSIVQPLVNSQPVPCIERLITPRFLTRIWLFTSMHSAVDFETV